MNVRAVRWGIIVLALIPSSEMVWLLISDGTLLSHIVRTLTSIVVAGVLAVVTGLPLGVALWRLERTRKILQPYLTPYYAVPIFAFYPVFIAIFGLRAWPVIIIAWAWR